MKNSLDNRTIKRRMLLTSVAFAALMTAILILSAFFPKYANTMFLSVGVALCIVFVVILHRQAKSMEEISDQRNYVLSRQVALAALSGKMITFAFRRRGNEIVSYMDMMTPENGDAAKYTPKNLSEMERFLNIREEDQRRISETAAKLKPGETESIRLHYSTDEGEQAMSVRLKCMRNIPDIVIGSASDCTQKIALSERAESVAEYAASIQARSMSEWQINATDGVWRCFYAVSPDIVKEIGMEMDAWCNYEKVLTGALKERFDPQDYYGYLETMSCEGICAMYRSGKTEFNMEYRVKPKGGSDYEWHRQSVRIFEDPETGDILCDLFVQNVHAEKKAEFERRERAKVMQKSLTALGGVFFGLYYIDLINNLCYTTKARGGEIVSQLCTPYPEMLNAYVAQYVHPDDRGAFLAAIDPYKLRRSFAEGSRYIQMGFRGLRGDAYYWSSMFIQPAKFENGALCDVVIALQRSEKTAAKAE